MHDNEQEKRVNVMTRIRAWLRRPFLEQLDAVRGKAIWLSRRLEDIFFEKRYGIQCAGFIENVNIQTVFTAARHHSRAYEAASCAMVRELLREAEKTNIVFDHFIDLGSGKGKACFYAATRRCFDKVIGVEFSDTLVQVANLNNRKFASNSGEHTVSFVHENAAEFRLPRGNNLIFLYNPFEREILERFLRHNADQFDKSHSVIAYLNDKQRFFLASAGFITIFRNQDNQCSLHKYCSVVKRTDTGTRSTNLASLVAAENGHIY